MKNDTSELSQLRTRQDGLETYWFSKRQRLSPRRVMFNLTGMMGPPYNEEVVNHKWFQLFRWHDRLGRLT